MAYEKQPYRVALVVSALIEDEEKRLLMVREAQSEFYGLWNQPAGHVDPGESIEEALLREVREETGYTHVRIDGIARIYYFVEEALLRINFRASLIDRDSVPLAEDVLEARWFTRQELEELRHQGLLRHEQTETAIHDWLEGSSAGVELIRTVSGP
jgi:ADP-ribose pyrophosphatase YjhB (NUDIX family)